MRPQSVVRDGTIVIGGFINVALLLPNHQRNISKSIRQVKGTYEGCEDCWKRVRNLKQWSEGLMASAGTCKKHHPVSRCLSLIRSYYPAESLNSVAVIESKTIGGIILIRYCPRCGSAWNTNGLCSTWDGRYGSVSSRRSEL